ENIKKLKETFVATSGKLKESDYVKKLRKKFVARCMWPACANPGKPTPLGFLCDEHFNRAIEMAERDPRGFEEFHGKFLSKQPSYISSKYLLLPIVSFLIVFSLAFFGIATFPPILIILIFFLPAIILWIKFPHLRPFSTLLFIIGFFMISFFMFHGVAAKVLEKIPPTEIFSDSLCMASCIVSNFINVEAWYKVGGIGKYCREVVCRRVEDIKLGCIDCFLIEGKVQRQNLIPFSTGSLLIVIKKGGEEKYCIRIADQRVCDIVPEAKKVYLSTHSNDFIFTTAFGAQCKYEKDREYECEIGNLKMEDLPKEFVFRFESSCKNFLNWKYKFKYTYNTTGFVSVNVIGKDFKEKPTAFRSYSTPGPLRIGVESVDKVLVKGIDEIVPLTIGFANAGRGDIYISKITLTTFGPEKEKLIIKECRPMVLNRELKSNERIHIKSGSEHFIDCVMDISAINVGDKEQKTYTFLVNVIYDVVFEKDGETVYVDTINYDCELSPRMWLFAICSDDETTCINNNEECFNKGNCEKVIFSSVNFPFISSYYEKCRDKCKLYLNKKVVGNATSFFNVSIEDKNDEFLSKIECKVNDVLISVDEKTKDENCPCEIFYDSLGEGFISASGPITESCVAYKYNKCAEIQMTEEINTIRCRAEITQSTIIHINSK
ncbi:MAG: hypothetical protein RMJ17_04000, partial [Candidatus Aenigmarchaeota archaeon]|nr:hypothetical protein [Candidatus Aenigmarchaeota archaeon]MDW8149722.1 hypothetical protein [Candidatus Aenigmarchaeota archaeon]